MCDGRGHGLRLGLMDTCWSRCVRRRGCRMGVQRWRRGTVCGGKQGRGLVREAETPLGVGAPWGWGYDMLGAGLADRGIWRWCWVERWSAGWWEAQSTPLEIGEEAPLEVVAEAPLELMGEREQMWWDLVVGMVVSSSGRGRGVG